MPGIVGRANRRQILPGGAVLGRHGPLLVEFSQIIQIIWAITHILYTGGALVRRRQPQCGDTGGGKGRRLAFDLFPTGCRRAKYTSGSTASSCRLR
jgi:hypothetical protein